MAIKAQDARTIVFQMLQHPQTQGLIQIGKFDSVAKATARFLGEIASCSGSDNQEVTLWFNLVRPINQLVTVPAASIELGDSFKERISNAKDLTELRSFLIELFDYWKQDSLNSTRKRKLDNDEHSKAETESIQPAPKKPKSKGPDTNILIHLRKKNVEPVNGAVKDVVVECTRDPMPLIAEETEFHGAPNQDLGQTHEQTDDGIAESEAKAPIVLQDAVEVPKDSQASVDSDLFLVMETDTKNKSTKKEGEAFMDIDGIVNQLQKSTPETFDDVKGKAITAFKAVKQANHAKSAHIGSELENDAAKRLERLRAHAPQLFTRLPPPSWEQYKKRLLKLWSQSRFYQKTFEQRLAQVMDVVYLPEELIAFSSGKWDRLESVLNLSVALAETLGSETEILPDVGRKWVEGKLKDIEWLKKMCSSIHGH